MVGYDFAAPPGGNLNITFTRVGNSGVLSAFTVNVIPEPSTAFLFLSGLGVAWYARRQF